MIQLNWVKTYISTSKLRLFFEKTKGIFRARIRSQIFKWPPKFEGFFLEIFFHRKFDRKLAISGWSVTDCQAGGVSSMIHYLRVKDCNLQFASNEQAMTLSNTLILIAQLSGDLVCSKNFRISKLKSWNCWLIRW